MIYSGPVEVAEPIQSQNQLNGLNQQWFKCFKPRQISSDRFPSFLKKKKKIQQRSESEISWSTCDGHLFLVRRFLFCVDGRHGKGNRVARHTNVRAEFS